MNNIIPTLSGNLPAYLTNKTAIASALAINDEVIAGGAGFPVLSIKGKAFTLVKNGERKLLTRADDPEEVLQTLELSVLRANTKSRVFYAKSYTEGTEGEAAKPDCYSSDGVAPAADARSPQSAKCALCRHSVWGTGKEGKGTQCTVNTRLAVIDPAHLGDENAEAYLLRVPAGSRANFAAVVKAANNRGIPYNALALKVGFDREAPSPKLTFRVTGLLTDAQYSVATARYEDDLTKAIVGLAPVAPRHEDEVTPAVDSALEGDLDAALTAKNLAKAKAAAAPVAPQPTLSDVDTLLGGDIPTTAAPQVDPLEAAYTRAEGGRYQQVVDVLATAFGDARVSIWSENVSNPDAPWADAESFAIFTMSVLETPAPKKGWNEAQSAALQLVRRVQEIPAVGRHVIEDTPAAPPARATLSRSKAAKTPTPAAAVPAPTPAAAVPAPTPAAAVPAAEAPAPTPPAPVATAPAPVTSAGLLGDLHALLSATDD